MPHKPEHKSLVASIIDQEVDAAQLAKDAYEQAKGAMDPLKLLTRRVVGLRAQGKITAKRAKELLREGFQALTLMQYVKALPKIQETVDKHVEEQHAQITKLGKPLRDVAPIRNADFKERELEKAGVLNGQGVVDGSGN